MRLCINANVNASHFKSCNGGSSQKGALIPRKPTTKHALLIDVDGVLLRDKGLLNYVSNKCVSFVRKYSNPKLATYNEAKLVNKSLYSNYGHTLRGMHKVWQKEYQEDSLQQLYLESYNAFNDIVYDSDSIDNLHSYMKSVEFFEQSQKIVELCLECKSKDIPVMMFSNAPFKWCEPVAMKLENIYGEGIFQDIITPGNIAFHPYLHKPDKQLYVNVEEQVQQSLQGSSKTKTKLIFVDDTMINLIPVINNPVWEPIIYGMEDESEHTKNKDHVIAIEKPSFCSTVHSFRWLQNYIKDVKTNKSAKQFNLILHGGPFYKCGTIQRLLMDCVDGLSEEDAIKITYQAHTTGRALITMCDEATAFKYCQCLIENGVYSVIE